MAAAFGAGLNPLMQVGIPAPSLAMGWSRLEYQCVAVALLHQQHQILLLVGPREVKRS